jgi:hypothetical protein
MKCRRSVVESIKTKVAGIRPVYRPSNLLRSTNVSLIRHEQASSRAWESASIHPYRILKLDFLLHKGEQ